jgi:two-component system OmpR family response regulator/two-component system response regulator CpxR
MPHGTLLVVDDDDQLRTLLTDYFKQQLDADVDVARDGAEALHQIATKRYAVVVLDLMMPHMSGIDFLDSLEALTSDPSLKTLRTLPAVLVVTCASPDYVSNGDLEQRFPKLVRGVLRKPLDVHALAAQIEALL